MKKQINVVGAVVMRDGTVLSAQRSQLMSLPGKWECPGGKMERGESPQDALAREMQEELLCTVSVGERVESTTHEYDFGIVTLTTYYVNILDGEPRLTEHSEIRWIPVAELRSVDWAPADVPAVDRIVRDHSA